MAFDPLELARARVSLHKLFQAHRNDRNMTLIDIGLAERCGQVIEDKLAIRLHVRKKLSGSRLASAVALGMTTPVPRLVEAGLAEFETDVVERNYRLELAPRPATQPPNPRFLRCDPLQAGISISNSYHNTFGTLGGFVRDNITDQDMILSNWHVLAGDSRARPGRRIYQPGRFHGGQPDDTIAIYYRDAMAKNMDAAVALLRRDGRPVDPRQFDFGLPAGVGMAMPGLVVKKSGSRTGLTMGRVKGVMGISDPIKYGATRVRINNIVTIEQYQPDLQVSLPGDSGSWWFDEATMQVVGLHFAGDVNPDVALAIDMGSVLNALNVYVPTYQSAAASASVRTTEFGAMRLVAASPVMVGQPIEVALP